MYFKILRSYASQQKRTPSIKFRAGKRQSSSNGRLYMSITDIEELLKPLPYASLITEKEIAIINSGGAEALVLQPTKTPAGAKAEAKKKK